MNKTTKNVGWYKINPADYLAASNILDSRATQVHSVFKGDHYRVRVWTATPEEQQEVRSALKPFSQ